jgi:stage V sporulation protein R
MPQSLTPALRGIQREIERHARAYGLDFFEIVYEVLDWEEINQVAAYGGYPARYPHWRFGMEYVELSRSYAYGLSKIYEMVINNDPTYAYLLAANHFVDQKLVMAHVCGHGDFFKHNYMFADTNRKMVDEMANHAVRIRRYMERYGVDEVERFLDRCLSLDNLIDYTAPPLRRWSEETAASGEESERTEPRRLPAKGYMEPFINPPGALAAERARLSEAERQETRVPARPEKDVLGFLLEHAPLKGWERDVLGIVREEAYYFAPQGRTKVMNEGWACVRGDTLVFTERGLLSMAELVAGGGREVSDGESVRRVYDRNVIPDHPSVRIRTRRGLSLEGSDNHRVLLPDGSWKRLDALCPGEKITISGGAGLWASEEVPLHWEPRRRVSLAEVASEAGVSLSTVLRFRAGRRVREAEGVAVALERYDAPASRSLSQSVNKRRPVRIPRTVDARLGAFLGYLVGDGHVSRVKRQAGLTTGDTEQAEGFERLARELFGVEPRVRRDGGRWRVLLYSETLSDFLVEYIGLTEGASASRKRIPDAILGSPEPVVRAFLRAYFDCDAYAGKQGVILSTRSDVLAEQSQLLLLNYGLLSRRRRQGDGCWHLHVEGASAARFAERVGFGLERKQEALRQFVAKHRWYKEERWEDEVVEVTHGRCDVFDISVEETHRYAAAGFINHNSYWHSRLMTERLLEPGELLDYADHHSGVMATGPGRFNPYKLGIELWRDIEERWDRGQHGPEWDSCDDYRSRRDWDTGEMRGREKIFEVRRHYNDVTFIDAFLTPGFVRRHGLFTYEYDPRTRQYVISDRDFHAVKEKLLFMLTNFGQPHIEVTDANFLNRGELVLSHRYEGIPLKLDHARETLENVQRLWKRPAHLETYLEDEPVVLSYDGTEHSQGSRAEGT